MSKWFVPICAWLALTQLPAAAQSGAYFTPGSRLAAACANCHGTEGRTQGQLLPRLAGQPRSDLERALREYKGGQRSGTVMPQIAKGLQEEQIILLAQWYASLPAGAQP
ncbi:c-type cytochrome [Massilia sp. W12]|uniref:c-type cytochrome n=1 Tax=Massilia sp. W12 TaxID=3126507 RepID=UPI0030D46D4E